MATPLTAEIIDLGTRSTPEIIPIGVLKISANTFEVNTGGGGGGSTRPSSGFLYPRGDN